MQELRHNQYDLPLYHITYIPIHLIDMILCMLRVCFVFTAHTVLE